MGSNLNSNWTIERTELLRSLRAEGLSFGQIADRLGGVTRNAVIGKATRIGIPRIPSKVAQKSPPVKKSRVKVQRVTNHGNRFDVVEVYEPIPVDLPEERSATAVDVLALQAHHCRFPVTGVGLTTLFCAEEKHPGYVYCARHCRIAYRHVRPMSEAEREIHRRVALRNNRNRKIA